jgi:DNA excision repair protein ERCC-3
MNSIQQTNPLIVQSNNTILLEVNNSLYTEARDAIGIFSHLEKSPEYIHTYIITPLSLWNAASLGYTPDFVIEQLQKYSKYPVPGNLIEDIGELMGRFGTLILETAPEGLVLRSRSPKILEHLARHPSIAPLVGEKLGEGSVVIPPRNRGILKQALIALGYPAHDLAGYVDGDPFTFTLKEHLPSGERFTIREYQKQAAEGFFGTVEYPGGSGVIVLPCGAGKTIVGIYAMHLLKAKTLILATNVTAARQWKRELLEKTSIQEDEIGEYSGEEKEIRPITVATYQILTYRKKKTEDFVHFEIFNSENWGLIVYDEVHLLPAPVFKFTADIQARRRLGLTATLIREDGHESDVFTLIGPKKFDIPWKDLERQGWIATARCIEMRVDLPVTQKLHYLSLPPKKQIRVAYENVNKLPVVRSLLEKHKDDQVLILGQYLSQLDQFATEFGVPVITGATPNIERERLYNAFRRNEIHVLLLSKVGNFAVDLPDANVAVQISGSFGSRQEEAQRLGRILRPKKNGEQALFYSVVTRESRELDFAMKRQLFLTEQGYTYDIRYYDLNGQ